MYFALFVEVFGKGYACTCTCMSHKHTHTGPLRSTGQEGSPQCFRTKKTRSHQGLVLHSPRLHSSHAGRVGKGSSNNQQPFFLYVCKATLMASRSLGLCFKVTFCFSEFPVVAFFYIEICAWTEIEIVKVIVSLLCVRVCVCPMQHDELVAF